MMEMTSNLSDDTENDLPPSPTRNNIHRRHTSVAAASNSNPHLDIPRRTNSKYAKQKKQSQESSRSLNKLVMFVALPAISCAVGFYWMLSSLDSSNSQHLRHENVVVANRSSKMDSTSGILSPAMKQTDTREQVAAKPANRDKIRAHTGKNVNPSQLEHPDEENKMQVTNEGDSEHVSKLETSSLQVKMKIATKGTAKDDSKIGDMTALNQLELGNNNLQRQKVAPISNRMKHPQTVTLEGWSNYRMASRVAFATAENIYGPMKNIDPDYGQITYESIRDNNKLFSRFIPTDGDGISTPGGFDSNSLIETPLMKKKRIRNGNHHPLGRIEDFDPKLKDVDSNQLSQFFDDDRVRIVDHNKDNDDDDDDGSRDDDEGVSSDTSTGQIGACRAMDWEYGYYPTCNEFHTIDVSRPYDDPKEVSKPRPENSMMKISYINHGHYRDVFIVEDNPWLWPNEYKDEHLRTPNATYGVHDEDKVTERITKAYRSAVLKTFNWQRALDKEHREMVNIEAVVMERLRKSPRIMDIYGHCGYSVTAEVVPIEFEEVVVFGEGYKSQNAVAKRNRDGLRPYNNFTAEEKLGFALTMAESLADLHGFSDGVIVHDDVQLCQWLRLPDGTMKLGDFNRASIMEYDIVNEMYCKFNNSGAFGNYRAPEEYEEKDLDDKIDVFSFGNNIYAMLTGLWGFYDLEDDQMTQEELLDGKLPYVDPRWKDRSYIERRLVELMEKCWIFNPDERVDIFYAVEFLRETVKESNRLKDTSKK